MKRITFKIFFFVKASLAPATVQRYETSLKHTSNFIKFNYRKNDIPIADVNHKFIKDYEFYLKTERNYSHNSATKYLKNFKKIIRIALANEYLTKDPFVNIRFTLEEVEQDFLEDLEIQRIIDKQKMNAYLKELADICGITKKVTTHIARHTCATVLLLANRVTMENTAKILGHKNTKMTQRYAKVFDCSIKRDMANVAKAMNF